ncbi:MAG: LCP family protein [Rectinemataceae bacterium]
MRKLPFDKSSLPLLAIISICVAIVVFLAIKLASNPVIDAMKGDRILNLLVILEEEGHPVATELFFYYPATGKGAVLDIPGDTGLILKSLKRVDRIDSVYQKGRPQVYLREIASLTATEVPLWIVFDEVGMARTADYLEGIEAFIPTPVSQEGPPRIYLPSGTTLLDGDKMLQYAAWVPSDENDSDAASRRQKVFQNFLRRIALKADWLSRPEVFKSWAGSIRTNVGIDGLGQFVRELSRIDIDHILQQRITGTKRAVDRKLLLFPHYDGDLVKDIVKQTLNALVSSGTALADKIYSVEILNGTPLKGLATRTAEIVQSFGFDVTSVGNAEREDNEATRILYKAGNAETAKNLADVIQCKSIDPDPGNISHTDADFTILLGADFNGRYVIGH